MAMESEAQVLAVLKSIPDYPPLFATAFPGEAEPVTYENMAVAIGAFERGLVTPSAFDRYLAGDDEALSPEAQSGLEKFYALGCATCHNGVGIGGGMYRRLGQVHPYETTDAGRFEVTGLETDRKVFKVPSLRNVTETGPWFHDGSIESLDDAIRLMAWHQLGLETTLEDRKQVRAFLRSLEGQPDPAYTAEPGRLESGPTTPAPDPR
jgi:cytochrome c peroxidase